MATMTEEKRRGPGRPKIDPAEKVVRVCFYVSPEVAEELEVLAKRKGFDRVGPWLAERHTRLVARSRHRPK